MSDFDRWLAALAGRHQARFTRPEFLKAVRALSARYVERRADLRDRSPIDSEGKRAAFASFYTPLHTLTIQAILRALHPPQVKQIVDLGCGTGAAGVGWALALDRSVPIIGVDKNGWAVAEAQWNCRQLTLTAHVKRGDFVAAAEQMLGRPQKATEIAVVAAWSVNELDTSGRRRLLSTMLQLQQRGATMLVVEPLANSAVPWWKEWSSVWTDEGGRADEWRCTVELPEALAELDRAAGFRREHLTARSLYLNGCI
jgi:hypothetical protein